MLNTNNLRFIYLFRGKQKEGVSNILYKIKTRPLQKTPFDLDGVGIEVAIRGVGGN